MPFSKFLKIRVAVCSLLFLFFFSGVGFAGLLEEWAETYTGSSGHWGEELVADGEGNVIVAANETGSWSYSDFLVIKYDSSGAVLWSRTFDGPDKLRDELTALAVDPLGGIYVSGRTQVLGASGTHSDLATIKYDSSGNLLYTVFYNGPNDSQDGARDLAVDSAGNAFVTGVSGGDLLTVKYGPMGVQEWETRIPGAGGSGIRVDGSGDVLVTGVLLDGFIGDYLSLKFDGNTGSELWRSTYNGPGNGSDTVYAMEVDGAGNLFVTGESTDIFGTDFTTVKYDSNGVEQWVHRSDLGAYARPLDLTLDSGGNVILTGIIDYSILEGCCGEPDVYSRSGFSATLKIDPTGAEIWSVLDPEGWSGGMAVSVDAAGDIFQTGFVLTHGAPPYSKIRTQHFNSSGNLKGIADSELVWRDRNEPAGMVLDALGNIYVAANGGLWRVPRVSLIKYSVREVPVIFSIDPSSGEVGDPVRILGDYFGPSGGSGTVTFNGMSASVVSWSEQEVIAVVPSGATTGPVVVTVGGVSSNADRIFEVIIPDFTIGVSPGSLTLAKKTCGVYTISTGAIGSFNDPVELSVSNLPNDTTGQFLPSSTVMPGESPVLEVCIGKKAPEVGKSIIITGSGGGNVHVVSTQLWIVKSIKQNK